MNQQPRYPSPGSDHLRHNGGYPGGGPGGPGGPPHQIMPGPGSNRSAGSGSDTSSQGPVMRVQGHSMYPGGQPPPVQRQPPGPIQPRPPSTVPDSGGVPGFDLNAVRRANIERAEALAAQQREEAGIMARQEQQEINMRMQNMQIRAPPPGQHPRYPGPPPPQHQHPGPQHPQYHQRVPPPQHFFPDQGGAMPGNMRPTSAMSQQQQPVSPVNGNMYSPGDHPG